MNIRNENELLVDEMKWWLSTENSVSCNKSISQSNCQLTNELMIVNWWFRCHAINRYHNRIVSWRMNSCLSINDSDEMQEIDNADECWFWQSANRATIITKLNVRHYLLYVCCCLLLFMIYESCLKMKLNKSISIDDWWACWWQSIARKLSMNQKNWNFHHLSLKLLWQLQKTFQVS